MLRMLRLKLLNTRAGFDRKDGLAEQGFVIFLFINIFLIREVFLNTKVKNILRLLQ